MSNSPSPGPDVEDCTLIHKLTQHKNWVRGVSASADSDVFATCSADKTVRLWNTSTGKQTQEYGGHKDWVWSVSVTEKRKPRVATGGLDKIVRIFDLAGRLSVEIANHEGTVNHVAFAPDGTRVASASYDRTLRIFEPDGREVAKLDAHTAPVLTCAYSPDGSLIATTCMDRILRVFSVTDHSIVMQREFEAGVTCATFSPDGHSLLLGGDGKASHLFSVAKQSAMYSIRGHKAAVHSVAFSADGKLVAAGSADSTASVWNAMNGDAVAATPSSGKDAHTDEVTGVAFDKSGKHLITTSDDCSVRIWGLPLDALEAHTSQMAMEDID